MNLKERAHQLRMDIPALLIALKDKETPIAAKILAGIVVIYALSPVDLIPDFIPILGYLDDLIILPALIALTIRFIPNDVLNRYREEAKNRDNSNKKWWYAIPFVSIWIVLLLFIIKCLIS